MSTFIKACSEDPNKLCLSRYTTYRNRIVNRLKASKTVIIKTYGKSTKVGWLFTVMAKLTVNRSGES